MDSTDRTDDTVVARGFFPFVSGENVRVERGGGVAFIARQHLTVARGGGHCFVSGGNLDIVQGGGTALVARTASVRSGFVGALMAWNVRLEPGARVLLRVTPAVTLAAAAGFAAGWLLRGRRKSRSSVAQAHSVPGDEREFGAR